jgi:hypothetical protein
MRMTDADLEYLVRALSEARSRATEITVSVRARVGVEHQLGGLGNSVVSKIERLLDEVRRYAVSDSETSAAPVEAPPIATAQIAPILPHASPPSAESLSSVGDEAGHWLHAFISDITENFRASSRITFATVEESLRRHKLAFTKDLEIARRMYRTYPLLFPAEASRAAACGDTRVNGVSNTKPEPLPENRNGF